MTRKDYISFANAIKTARLREDSGDNIVIVFDGLVNDMMNIFENDNPAFDRSRFWAACSVDTYPSQTST